MPRRHHRYARLRRLDQRQPERFVQRGIDEDAALRGGSTIVLSDLASGAGRVALPSAYISRERTADVTASDAERYKRVCEERKSTTQEEAEWSE